MKSSTSQHGDSGGNPRNNAKDSMEPSLISDIHVHQGLYLSGQSNRKPEQEAGHHQYDSASSQEQRSGFMEPLISQSIGQDPLSVRHIVDLSGNEAPAEPEQSAVIVRLLAHAEEGN